MWFIEQFTIRKKIPLFNKARNLIRTSEFHVEDWMTGRQGFWMSSIQVESDERQQQNSMTIDDSLQFT